MKFSEDFIEKVREANNLVDLIGLHTQLKPAAGGYMGRCPFPDHQEKTASFSVSEAKQVYYCFGCHKKGNIFRFVQELMGMAFPDAVEFLAARANIALPENTFDPAKDQQARRKKELTKATVLAAQFFHEQFLKLPPGHPAKIYALQKRQLSYETIQEFQVGYAPEEWDSLVRYFQAKGMALGLAEENRLIKARKEGNGFFDMFRDRLMFPIENPMGEAIAFGGRIITQGEPKYLNSADTPIFTKGKILYGLSQSAKYIRSEDQVIVVEGYMDLVSLFQAGIRNVVATMGTAFTPEHARIFSRMTRNVVVLFDGDEAGQHAAERSLPILLAANLHPKGLILPGGQDPDDFVRSTGADSLRELINQGPDLFSMVLSLWMKGYRHEASQKVNLVDQIKPLLESIPDSRLRSLYESEVATKLGVDLPWLQRALSAKPGPNETRRGTEIPKSAVFAKSSTTPAPAPAPAADLLAETEPSLIVLKGASKPELMILSISLRNINNFNKLNESGLIPQLPHLGVRSVLEKAALTARQHPEKFDKLASLLISLVDQPDLLFAYQSPGGREWNGSSPDLVEASGSASAENEANADKEVRVLSDCMKRVRDQILQAQADLLMSEIRTEPSSEKLEKLMKLQRDRRALNVNKEQ